MCKYKISTNCKVAGEHGGTFLKLKGHKQCFTLMREHLVYEHVEINVNVDTGTCRNET